MNKGITIYELLGLIKEGKAPKKIEYKGDTYIYAGDDYSINDNREDWLITKYDYFLTNFLNEEVEIINCEEWKQIVGFPNYEISTKGNIRTKERLNNKNDIKKSKLLSKRKNNVGYEYVILSNKTQKHKTLTVHRLMAKTFLNNYSDNLEVNHINGIKDDNRIENLEMTTHSENVKKRYEIGNIGNNYKAVNQYDLNNNYIATYKSSYDAEKVTGIGRTCIGGCCRKEHHTAGGYIWKFAEEDKPIIEKLDVALLSQSDNWLWCPSKDEFSKDIELNSYIIQNIRENTLYFQRKINEIIEFLNRKEDE